jgi:ABC-2 type transport system ATP-binding protein
MPASFSCTSLAKSYGNIIALKGVTLTVEPGVVGLLGPNGAGKSTLLSVLLGQTPATSGRASVLGFDARRQQSKIRQRIGFMPENDCLIPGHTGVGYVHYCGRLSGMSYADAMQRTHEVLDYVALEEARYRPAEQYSTGMKQRLKLAQALVHDPDLIFLDEPTNGMDPQGRQVMLGLIEDLGRTGISVILSSHLLPDVERVCARVVIMGGGEVLTTGDIAEMRKPHPTLYTVDFAGEDGMFARRLVERGVRVLEAPLAGHVAVELPASGTQNIVLEAARDTGAAIRGLHPKRSSLEEMFLAALNKQARSKQAAK